VFGGSFDPVHNGHLAVADAVLTRHSLDSILFVPARQPPHKPAEPMASGEHRLAMICLAIEGHPAFAVSDCELKRAGKSFTVDTIHELRRQLGRETQLFFLIGSDSVPELPRWRNVSELAGLCTFIVAARPDWPLDALDALDGVLPADSVAAMKDMAVRETANRASSTEIRGRIAADRSIRGLVPDGVLRYIRQNHLYRPT